MTETVTVTEKKWALESYAKQENNIWKEITIDRQSSYLSIVSPMVIIALDDMGNVDYVDLSGEAGKIDVQYSRDNIGIGTTDKNGNFSRIRIRFANGSANKTGLDYCLEVVNELKKFVPVIQHPSHSFSVGQLKTVSKVITKMVIHMNKWALESYARWENNVWKDITIDEQSSYLLFVYPKLIIVLDNMGNADLVDLSGKTGKIEVFYLKTNLGVRNTEENGNISKIKMRFANGHEYKSGSDCCNEVVDELKKFVPVIHHPPPYGNSQGRRNIVRQVITGMAQYVWSYFRK